MLKLREERLESKIIRQGIFEWKKIGLKLKMMRLELKKIGNQTWKKCCN